MAPMASRLAGRPAPPGWLNRSRETIVCVVLQGSKPQPLIDGATHLARLERRDVAAGSDTVGHHPRRHRGPIAPPTCRLDRRVAEDTDRSTGSPAEPGDDRCIRLVAQIENALGPGE